MIRKAHWPTLCLDAAHPLLEACAPSFAVTHKLRGTRLSALFAPLPGRASTGYDSAKFSFVVAQSLCTFYLDMVLYGIFFSGLNPIRCRKMLGFYHTSDI